MKVSVFGAGYVGLVIAACLAEMGNSVVCVDIDEARMNALNCGEMPIHEPGLTELVMRALCAPFLRNRDRILIMDWASAELSKYVANAMLARRISVMNRMALLAERMGADIERVRLGIGSDPRIGTHLLCAGCGWGGSCFPKDVKALARMGEDAGHPLTIIESVRNVNDAQRLLLWIAWCSALAMTCGACVLAFGAWPSSRVLMTCARRPVWSSLTSYCAWVRRCRRLILSPCPS